MRRAVLTMALGLPACALLAQQESQPEPVHPSATRAARDTAVAERPRPSPPVMVSFTLHNSCPHELTLFYGDHPLRSSGRQGYIGANSTEFKSLRPGESIWIIDKERRPVSVFTASAPPQSGGALTVEIPESCAGFVWR